MPISELVIGTLRPDVAQEGLSHIRKNQPSIFNALPGSLSNRVGHVIKHNGKDISSEYKPVLALEWDSVESFHAFYPASDAFKSFAGIFGPYAGGKPKPQLFKPEPDSSLFQDLVSKGAALMFIAPAAAEKKDDVSAAWSELLQIAKKEDGLIGKWAGWGIEGDEGTWAGILSWKGVEEHERSSDDKSVIAAVQKLKALVEVEEYLVSFTYD